MSIIPLEKLLESDPDGSLGKIVHIARNMDKLTLALRASIAPDLAENLVAAATRDDQELVLVGSTSAWAARLRYESETLMETARRHGVPVTSCRIIVQSAPM